MSEDDPPKAKGSVDFTGLKIAAALAPVLVLFIFLGNADMGLTAFIVLGVMIFAIKLHWTSRKHTWFWAVVVFILALHIPLLRVVRWPQGRTPTLFYTMPAGIADFLIISAALGLSEKFFSKSSSSKMKTND